MLPNPYTPGSLPTYLAGRNHERSLVEERLGRVRLLRRAGGPLLAFHGPRGLGKTSLLRQAEKDAAAAGFVTAWVTGRSDRAMVDALASSLVRFMAGVPASGRGARLMRRLEKLQVEFGIPGAAKVVADVRGSAAPSGANVGAASDAAAALPDILSEAGTLAGESAPGLVVFVDEFHEASLSDRASLLIALQEFDGNPPVPVAVVAAGLPSVHAAVTEAATFGERTHFVEVAGLNDVAVADALQQPASDLGVTWTTDALEEAIQIARGYPHQVQLVGQAAWNAARPASSGATVEVGHVRLGRADVEARMRDLFRSRWGRTTREHRRLLSAIAEGGADVAARAEIAARMGVTSNALSRPREELISRGLIEPGGTGQLRFTIPGFAEFVREQAGDA
ncbi:AAA family ATPase [Nocardioides zeae]